MNECKRVFADSGKWNPSLTVGKYRNHAPLTPQTLSRTLETRVGGTKRRRLILFTYLLLLFFRAGTRMKGDRS